MDQRSIVMLGVGIWGLVALVAIYCGVNGIERDLTARSRAALADAGLHWATVSYSGRDATLHGVAPGGDARVQARAVLAALTGVRAVHDHTAAE